MNDTPPDESGTMSRTQIIVRLILLALVMPLFIFLPAGRWDWPVAWAVAFVVSAAMVGSRLLVLEKHPDLLNERAESMSAEDAKPWDRILAPAMGATPLLVLVVAGLDERFDWSPPIGIVVELVGLGLIVLGYALATWAMWANRFFSGVVRIQHDRGHQVVENGPYTIVRHPGYTGSVMACVGFALALASHWAFVAVALNVIVTIIRTHLEDRTLTEELPGYAAFTERTRHRLVPGVW